MLGTWSIAASMPAIDGSAAPRMSFTLRARLPSWSSAMACSSATIAAQSSCGPDPEDGGAVGVEAGQESLDGDETGGVGLVGGPVEPGRQAPSAAQVAHRVGAGAAGDRQQPGAGAGVAPERRQRPVGPEEDLLGDVVGLLPADQLRAEAPHLALAPPDPGREGNVVAVLSGEVSFLFASITGAPIDRRRAHRVVQASAKKAGLVGEGQNLRVHDLRAAFALNSLRGGLTLAELQRALGHTRADQSLAYSRLVERETVIRSSVYDRDELAEVMQLKEAS